MNQVYILDRSILAKTSTMNLSTPLAQEPIICNLCRNVALRFCNYCQVSLCVKCVSKHVNKHDLHSHDVAPVKDKTIKTCVSQV